MKPARATAFKLIHALGSMIRKLHGRNDNYFLSNNELSPLGCIASRSSRFPIQSSHGLSHSASSTYVIDDLDKIQTHIQAESPNTHLQPERSSKLLFSGRQSPTPAIHHVALSTKDSANKASSSSSFFNPLHANTFAVPLCSVQAFPWRLQGVRGPRPLGASRARIGRV